MRKILVPLAPGFEEIEAVTVIGILRRVRADVIVAGLTAEAVKGAQHLSILPDMTLDEVDSSKLDMLVVLGGDGALYLRNDPRVRRIIIEMARREAYLAAICRGPIALAAAGVLQGRRATSGPSVREELIGAGATYVEDRVAVDGNIITSRLPGTAVEFALALVKALYSEKHANYVAATIGAPL